MPELPTPAERPDADVVLYDGRCGFCRARVEQLRWFDGSGGRLAYLSLHEPEVASRYPDAPPERLLDEMCVVDHGGVHHWGAGAVRYLSRRLPRLWWLAPVMHVPGSMWLWRPLYAWVSRNRYLLGGKVDDGPSDCEDGACSLHR
ncbi:MAG: DUF393 domain-containing protein [Planctomycetota bacterium]